MNFIPHLTSVALCNLAQSVLEIIACAFLFRIILFTRKNKSKLDLRWLIPLGMSTAIYMIDELIYSVYLLIQDYEPEPINTITDITDVIASATLLYAIINLWRTIRDKKSLVLMQDNPQNIGNNDENVWPPPPTWPA